MNKTSYVLTGPENPSHHFEPNISLGKLIFDKLKYYGNKVHQISYDTAEELTCQEILIKSCKLAVFLQDNGLSINDRIAISSENNIGFGIPVCAGLFSGAAISPLNPLYTEREFLHTMRIVKPKFIFVSPLVADTVKNFIDKLILKPKLIMTLDHADLEIPSINMLIQNITLDTLDNFKIPTMNTKEHVCAILCSSGTTGLPKGVMLTDSNYLSMMESMNKDARDFLESQCTLHLLPYFHAYCFAMLIMGLVHGSKSIVLSHFDEESFLEALEKYKISTLTAVPPLMVFLAKNPLVDRYDLSSIKMILCGAAPLSAEVAEEVKKRLNNPEVRQGYGMTETTLGVVVSPENSKKVGSVGILKPGVSAKVIPISEDGKWSQDTLGPNGIGELCFKGDLIMKGYCDNQEATDKTIDKEGWLHTGDVGYYDEDGYFYIVDRIKELIKYKGFQVPPAELEALLLSHPNIKDAAVIGIPDEAAGELPFAFVVKQEHSEISADEIIKFINGQVSNQKKLRGGVKFLDSIPKTASGKILRRELRNIIKSKL